jgi:TPR repeat protein
MRKQFLAAIVATILAGSFSAAAFADELKDGIQAYQSEDYATALKLLTPYAEKGDAESAFLLGEMYGPRSWGLQGENRNGVEQDNKQAILWWTKASELGHAKAQLRLGWWLMNGKSVVKKDEKAGMTWLLKAADKGQPQAQYEAGVGLWKGKGVAQDLVQAHMWLSLAAEKDGFENAKQYRDDVAKSLTPEQIAESQRLAQEWTAKKKY